MNLLAVAANDAPAAGISLSIATAVLWAISPMFMASVGRKIGSHHTNLVRLLIATVMLTFIALPVYVLAIGRWPALPTQDQWFWLLGSSFIGMVLGDACFYEGLVRLGPRRAIKINTLAPVFSLAIGWFWLGEKITPQSLIGAGLVIAAVMYAAMIEIVPANGLPSREPGRISTGGLLFGIGAAIGTAGGAILQRRAFLCPSPAPLDPVVVGMTRVIGAAILMWTLAMVMRHARHATARLLDRSLRWRLIIGVAMGPVGGILCYAGALKNAPAGLVSTLVATSPLLTIPLVAWRYKTRIRIDIVIAAAVACAGVGMISWGR